MTMKTLNYHIIILLLAILMLLPSCAKREAEVAHVDFSHPPYGVIPVDGEENCYYQYCEPQDGFISSPQPAKISYTCGELIYHAEPIPPETFEAYGFYKANEAFHNEVVIKKYDRSGAEELWMICCLGNTLQFENTEQLLRFFGITSAESIASVDIYMLQYQEKAEKAEYILYGTFENIGQEVYGLLMTMERNPYIKPGGNIFGNADQNSPDDKAWADGVLKLVVTLSSGVVLPVFYAETVNYLGILDNAVEYNVDMYFSADPNADAVSRLKDAISS